MASFEAISVDLPWSSATARRTAIAAATRRMSILFSDGLDPGRAVAWIIANAGKGAVVVLDVPVDGCEGLSQGKPWRPVDDRLARMGIPVLPSYKSGDMGQRLHAALHRKRPDLRVHETYPYAILRVLWALREETGTVDLGRRSYGAHTKRWPKWWTWPPRYKRARSGIGRIQAIGSVGELIRSCGNPYVGLVRDPRSGASWSELARLCDEYDAVLGLIAARSLLTANPWSWRAEVAGAAGSIVTIGPPWLRADFVVAQSAADGSTA